jgi:hypothetical protein
VLIGAIGVLKASQHLQVDIRVATGLRIRRHGICLPVYLLLQAEIRDKAGRFEEILLLLEVLYRRPYLSGGPMLAQGGRLGLLG